MSVASFFRGKSVLITGASLRPADGEMSTAAAVRAMLRAVARGKREEIVTFHGKLGVAVERVMPWLTRAMAEKMFRRSGK